MQLLIRSFERRPVLGICLFIAVMLIPHLDIIPVSIMEARDFVTAREMITDGNWLLTTMNGEVRYEKPPLPTWLSAISAMIFGVNSIWAMRLPGILLIMVTGVFVYLLSGTILKDKTHSLINGLIAVTSYYVVGIVFEAPWDIFTHGFMLVGILSLIKLFSDRGSPWRHAVVSGIFIGFSIMSKGPISLYALFLPFLLAYGFIYKYRGLKAKALPLLLVLVLAIVTGGWWYIYVRVADPQSFLSIAREEVGNWSSYNVRPFYYYWGFFAQSGLWAIPALISLLYPYLKNRVANLKAYRFSLLWTIFAVVLLSVVPEKKSRYLMPVLIPLAINTGFYIEYLFREFQDLTSKREKWPVWFNFGLISLMSIAAPAGIFVFFRDHISVTDFFFIASCIVLPLLGISVFIQLLRSNIRKVFYLSIILYGAIFLFVLPVARDYIAQGSLEPVEEMKERAEEEGITLYGYDTIQPEFVWLYGEKIPLIKDDKPSRMLPDAKRFGILTNEENALDNQVFRDRYQIEYSGVVDINLEEGSNSRKVHHFFILNRVDP
ncbi:MAG: ArnT family glycosyltransferase [Marinilabiliaceae bacterium]